MTSKVADRFVRLPPGAAGGTKLCGRDVANPSLSYDASIDDRRFRIKLETRFGPPDRVGDAAYSYSVRDRTTNFEFEVYSAQSGPSYGGDVTYFEQGSSGYRLRDDVLAVLGDFDRWIESTG